MSTKPSPTPEYAIKRCDFVTQELWHVTRNEKWICLCNTRESAVDICRAMNNHERLVKALKNLMSAAEDSYNHNPSDELGFDLQDACTLLSELEQEEQK